MQGIDLRYLELIDTGYILGKKKRYALNGIIYNADLYYNGLFYKALIYRYWLGGGELIKAVSQKGEDMLHPINASIENFYENGTQKGPDIEYILREVTKALLYICMLICLGMTFYNGYLFIIGRYFGAEINIPYTIKKGITCMVIWSALYFIRLKVFSFKINKTKECDRNER